MSGTARFAWGSAALMLLAVDARADFVAGRIYISVPSGIKSCPQGFRDRIFEFDPLTGETRTFATVPVCTSLTGLTFTPDGRYLRASAFNEHAVYEIDGDGNSRVALDASNGLMYPVGRNNIAFGRFETFYAVNEFPRTLVQILPDGRWTVVADANDGITGRGAIDVAPDGDVYYAGDDFRVVRRFTEEGEGGVFDTLPGPGRLLSIAVDSTENVFAYTSMGIYRYDAGDASSRRLLSPFGGLPGISTLILSPDERRLYAVVYDAVLRLDVDGGDIQLVGRFPLDNFAFAATGAAVFVPEPSTISLLGGGLLMLGAGFRSRHH